MHLWKSIENEGGNDGDASVREWMLDIATTPQRGGQRLGIAFLA